MPKREKDLENILAEKGTYDQETQDVLSSIEFERSEIEKMDSMKRTEGWKILDKKIREELRQRIEDLVVDDLKIQTLIALLKVSDTRKRSNILKSEINKILPE